MPRQADDPVIAPISNRSTMRCWLTPLWSRPPGKRCRTSCNLPSRVRRDEQRYAHPGRAADQNSAHHREGLAPAFGRHADMRESKRRMVSGDRGRHGIKEPDCGAEARRSNCRKSDLSDRKGRAAGHQALGHRQPQRRPERRRALRRIGVNRPAQRSDRSL